MTVFGGEQRARLVRMTMFGGEQRKRDVQPSHSFGLACRMTINKSKHEIRQDDDVDEILCLSFLWRATCETRQDDGVWWRAACKVRQDDVCIKLHKNTPSF